MDNQTTPQTFPQLSRSFLLEILGYLEDKFYEIDPVRYGILAIDIITLYFKYLEELHDNYMPFGYRQALKEELLKQSIKKKKAYSEDEKDLYDSAIWEIFTNLKKDCNYYLPDTEKTN